jgi:type II secretory pathway component PulF
MGDSPISLNPQTFRRLEQMGYDIADVERRWQESREREQQHRQDMHAARLASLANVNLAMSLALERIQQAEAELADLTRTRRDILADITANARADQ